MAPDPNTTKTTAEYVQALAAPFIAGFAVQQGVEVLSSFISLNSKIDGNTKWKKAIFSAVSVILSWIIVANANLDVLKPFIQGTPDWVNRLTTIIFISAGTEGFNSLLKWFSYKKDTAKATAATTKSQAGNAVHSLAS
jgi:hypothetical protein